MSPDRAVYVRRNSWTLPEDDETLRFYAAAVSEMKGREPGDPTSWSYQAAVHGTAKVPPKPLWNGCQHGSWYFLAWHRMYLYYFERVVRATVVELGGPDDWALPYWDYGAGGEQAQLPHPFRDSRGGANSLFSPRAHGMKQGNPMPFQIASPTQALARPQFIGAAEFGGGITAAGGFWSSAGVVEITPHNAVHNYVGGLMNNPRTAAQDPIFWLHHANIDRLWFEWSKQPGRKNPTDPGWTTQSFSFFDADGTQVSLKGADIDDIVGQLGYTYETHVPAAVPSAAEPPRPPLAEVRMSDANGFERADMAGASERPVRLVGRAESVAVHLDDATVRSLGRGLGTVGPEPERRVYLNVEDIEGETSPETVYGIYVNLPEDASEEVAESRRVGNLPFFGIERARDPRGDEHPHGLRVTVEITPLVRALEAEGDWDERELRVSFLPLGMVDPEVEDPPVRVGRVSLSYT
ncbi:tyrosinase family protein [Streptomyces sp. NPDC002643]